MRRRIIENPYSLEPRFQLLLQEFYKVTQQEDMTAVETYLLFLQVAGESFQDRQTFLNRFVLSEGKLAVMGLLKAAGQLTPSELAQAAGVTPGTITGLLAGLEHAGLIRREEHLSDGRKAAITLAPEALALYEKAMAQRFHHIEGLLSSFTLQEQLQLRTLLGKLHKQLLDDPSS